MVTNLETESAMRAVETPAKARVSTDIFTTMDAARRDWEELSERAIASPYQSFAFLSAWRETIGEKLGVAPFVIVLRDASGRPQALLPLCVEKPAGLRVAAFLGGRDSNFNLPLLRPGARFDETTLRAALREAAKAAQEPPDLFLLKNQPRSFDGLANPLVFADSRPSASFAYGAALPESVDALAARQSKDTRKKLRKKEARLAEMGELSYEHCVTGARAGDIVDALIAQKTARLAEMGVADDFDAEATRRLLQRLSESGESSGLELHALSVGGRVVATYAGLAHAGRFSGMLNSFEADEEIARSSPGDLLLHALMRDLVTRGFTRFDLGVGEARYKNAVCDETIELYDTLLPVSLRGAAFATLLSAYLQLKRQVKQTPVLAKAHAQLRRALRGRE